MKNLMKLALIGTCMAALVAFAAGCTPAPGSETELSDGSAQFSQGDLVVKLDANPTTGYEWTFQIDGDAVQPDGDEFIPASDGSQPKTGEGGVHEFRFKAEGSRSRTPAHGKRPTTTRRSCLASRSKAASSRRSKNGNNADRMREATAARLPLPHRRTC